MNKTVAFHTLGCKLNYSETSTISRSLEKDGFLKRNFNDKADVYVINTCSVTENADKECKQIVRKIKRQTPEAIIVIIGCYAQLKAEEIAKIEGVDLVLGAAEKFNLPFHLKQFTDSKIKDGLAKVYSCDIGDITGFESSFSLNDRTRTFLKVQDGCDYNCSFCTIPLARGHSRSDSITGVIANMQELAKAGIKEIVLTGINLGDFGKGNSGGKERENTFLDLIKEMDNVNEIERIRISSIEPNLLSNEIIDFVSTSKRFMPHFHIPLQSGSNKILSLMRRRYKRELYEDRIDYIKELMPHCCIGADVIVGFPTENDLDFRETYDFINNINISYLHVFTYSERDNTLAKDLKPIVPIHIRNERNSLLREISNTKMNTFTTQNSGLKRKVLFEIGGKDGTMEGYTDNYLKVQIPYNKEWVNKIVEWEIV